MRQDGGREVGGWEVEIPGELKSIEFPFYVFSKILIPYSRSSRIDQTDLAHFRHEPFSNFQDVHFQKLQNSNMIFCILFDFISMT